MQQQLAPVVSELRFFLITSAVQVLPLSEAGDAVDTDMSSLKLAVSKSGNDKCERCWHHLPEVGSIAKHPTLCQRCVDNVDGDGEQRQYW